MSASFPTPTPIEKRNAALARAEVVGIPRAARECGVSQRALYHWRDGRHPSPRWHKRREVLALVDQLIAPGADVGLIIAQWNSSSGRSKPWPGNGRGTGHELRRHDEAATRTWQARTNVPRLWGVERGNVALLLVWRGDGADSVAQGPQWHPTSPWRYETPQTRHYAHRAMIARSPIPQGTSTLWPSRYKGRETDWIRTDCCARAIQRSETRVILQRQLVKGWREPEGRTKRVARVCRIPPDEQCAHAVEIMLHSVQGASVDGQA
jgi:hypothetical protein